MQYQNKKRLMQQRNLTCCNIRTKLLQQPNKTQSEKQHQKKKTDATKKYYLLQHQTKATAITEQSVMREAT
jgi:hypothetical protein